MAYGITASPSEIERLKRHSLRQLSIACDVSRETAARAVRGQRLTSGNLRALLEAAERLEGGTPRPTDSSEVAALRARVRELEGVIAAVEAALGRRKS